MQQAHRRLGPLYRYGERSKNTTTKYVYLNLARGEGGASVFEDLVQMVSRFN